MQNLLATAIVASVIFALAVVAMSVGLLLRGKVLRGGCGSSHGKHGPVIGCEACSKKRMNLCDEDDADGLAGPSLAATMGRFSQKNDFHSNESKAIDSSSTPRS